MGRIILNYVKSLKNEKAHYIFIGFPVIISMCIGITLKDNMFETYLDTKTRMFAIVCVAIWIGLFNSVLEICKERNTIGADLRDGFTAVELFVSRFLVQGVVCFFQAIIIYAICSLFVEFPIYGAITEISYVEYIFSIFLITFAADIMGLLISSLCPNNDMANRSLPFVLMVQFIFSGQLFDLGDTIDKVSYFTISKWGMDALGSIGDITNLSLPIMTSLTDSVKKSYECSVGHIIFVWIVLIVFIVAFSSLSVVLINKIKKQKC